jgi:hypothetical protein
MLKCICDDRIVHNGAPRSSADCRHAANVVAAVRASKVVAMVAAVNQEGSSRLSRGEGCKAVEARRRAAKWQKPEGGLQGSGS